MDVTDTLVCLLSSGVEDLAGSEMSGLGALEFKPGCASWGVRVPLDLACSSQGGDLIAPGQGSAPPVTADVTEFHFLSPAHLSLVLDDYLPKAVRKRILPFRALENLSVSTLVLKRVTDHCKARCTANQANHHTMQTVLKQSCLQVSYLEPSNS